jgi:signal transduction histidine kinase
VRLTSALRVVVSFAGLLIYLVDPSEHPERRALTVTVLALFAAYSAATYVVLVRSGRCIDAARAAWLDLAWITVLVGVSEASSEVFYPLYLFSILGASFGRGARPGVPVVLGAVLSFAVVGAITSPRGPNFAVTPFVIRALYLLVLGYLTVVWGGYEVGLRARLALLREVSTFSNPRFGVDRTIGNVLESLRAFYNADRCVLVMSERASQQLWIRSAVRGQAPALVTGPSSLGGDLLLAPPAGAALLARARPLWGEVQLETEFIDPHHEDPTPGEERLTTALLTALEAKALISVPFHHHAGADGRLFVARREARRFEREEIDFLRHVLDQVLPTLENIRLVDRLASDAAEEERRRIARDLHDSVIQPYLGLRLGLSAAQTAFAAGRSAEASAHVDQLAALADGELERLRRYVQALRAGGDTAASEGALDAALRRFASRFSDATGIQVEVVTHGALPQSDRLAAEVFQMVAEGLSNVRRHTPAHRAEVHLAVHDGHLELTLQNDKAEAPATFHPHSLEERAAALGGTLRVERVEPGLTAVRITIPL